MGNYTELNLKIRLRKDTPENITRFLKELINDKKYHNTDYWNSCPKNVFFDCKRWFMLFFCTNWDEDKFGCKFYINKDYYYLEIESEFKNYDNETDDFLDWIRPYIAGNRKKKQYIGNWRDENMDDYWNIYLVDDPDSFETSNNCCDYIKREEFIKKERGNFERI